MNINKLFFILFEKIIFIVIIITLLSCTMNTQIKNKSEKINKVEFKINKKIGVKIND